MPGSRSPPVASWGWGITRVGPEPIEKLGLQVDVVGVSELVATRAFRPVVDRRWMRGLGRHEDPVVLGEVCRAHRYVAAAEQHGRLHERVHRGAAKPRGSKVQRIEEVQTTFCPDSHLRTDDGPDIATGPKVDADRPGRNAPPFPAAGVGTGCGVLSPATGHVPAVRRPPHASSWTRMPKPGRVSRRMGRRTRVAAVPHQRLG